MGLLDNFGKISSQRQQTERKSGNNAEENRIAAQIASLQAQQKDVFLQLGKRYAELFADSPAPEMTGFLDTIRSINAQIKECEKQRRALRGLVLCERCGAEQDKNAAFCSCCGNRLIPENAVICPNCRSVLPEGTVFCSNCGTRVQSTEQEQTVAEEPKTCPKCGAVVGNDEVFCTECGAKISEDQESGG